MPKKWPKVTVDLDGSFVEGDGECYVWALPLARVRTGERVRAVDVSDNTVTYPGTVVELDGRAAKVRLHLEEVS